MPVTSPSRTGNRVHLRPMAERDLDAFGYWLGPGHAYHNLNGPYYATTPVEAIPGIIEERRAAIRAGDSERPDSLVIADRESDDMLGVVTCFWESEETYWLLVGIVIYDPANWRGGVGTEALGLWSDELFREMPELARLDLRTWSGNYGMMSLATKLGYQEEARFRKARIVEGEYYDGLGYGVLREEWEARYPEGFAAWLANRG